MSHISFKAVAETFRTRDPFKWQVLYWWAEQYISRCIYCFLLGASFGFGIISVYEVKGWLS